MQAVGVGSASFDQHTSVGTTTEQIDDDVCVEKKRRQLSVVAELLFETRLRLSSEFSTQAAVPFFISGWLLSFQLPAARLKSCSLSDK